MTIYSNSNIWVDDLIFIFLMIHTLNSCCDQSQLPSVNCWIKSIANLIEKYNSDDSKAMSQQHHIKHNKFRDTYKCCVWKTESKVILVWFPGALKSCKELFTNQSLVHVWRGKGHSKPSNEQNLLYHFEKLWIWDLDIPSHVPWKVNHGHYGLHALQLIPLVPFHCQLVLTGCTNTQLQQQSVSWRNNYQPRPLCL